MLQFYGNKLCYEPQRRKEHQDLIGVNFTGKCDNKLLIGQQIERYQIEVKNLEKQGLAVLR